MGFRARRQGFLDGGAQSRAFVVAVVVPALGGNPVEVRDRPPQHRGSPDFPGAGAFQQRVAGGVAFDADGVEAGGRVLDGEVEAEGVAFAGGCGGPAQRADVLADDLAEAVVPLDRKSVV